MRDATQQPATISDEAARQIRAHAEDCCPSECCGLVFESGVPFDGGVRRCTNVQERLHREEPESFPRTARHAFRLADADQLLLARSFDGEHPARVLYHSHINCAARFSAADLAGASIDGEPLYPDLLHLVVAVQDGVAGAMALFSVTRVGATEIWRSA